MHPSSVFHTDEQAARAIIAQSPLANIAANGPNGPIIAVVPLVWSEDGASLIGHVGRANAFWQNLQGDTPNVTAVFRSDDAYVSASAYPSKAEHSRVVPTWNYIAAEARGQLSFKIDLSEIRASVSALSDQMEAERAAPWGVDDAPEAYIDKLASAIVAFEIEVTELRGVRKLSQNKTASDRAGVVFDLSSQSDREASLAAEMEREPR